jgi:hypothetical protein
MKVRLRSKADGVLRVLDENGDDIEGLVDFRVNSCVSGQKIELMLVIRGPEVIVDTEASVKHPAERPAVEKPARKAAQERPGA